MDPLGKFVRVHYLSNCNNNATADDWRFRPMWWFGVPAGLKDPQDIQFKRIEKLTNGGKQSVKPAGSSQYVQTDANGYGAVSDKHFNSPKEWNNISNFYFSGENIASKGWKRLVGLSDKAGSKTYDNAGDTEKQWNIYKQDTQGLKGIFVDWESAGRRWYDMTYVSEMEDTAWKNRDKNPLRFAAGVYRFAGNWHYAVGQKHNTPKIADHFNLTYPAVTKVKDTKKLTGDEQEAVKNAIVDANKNAKYYSDLVDKVEVSEKGDATITFKDNTTRTMPASLLVTKDETDKDKYKPTLTTRTPVVNLKNLTSDEKTKIRQAIINDNGGSSPNEFLKHVKKNADSKQYEFNVKEDGSVEVTYEDDSKLTIPAEDLVFQGPKIADWAPYVVPDVIEVDDITKLTSEDITKIVNAFDEANKGITPYDEAKENNTGKKVPVTVDQTTGDATIKWKDGSTTTIAAWQFLKQKPKAPSPDPQPPAPTPAAEKEFIVEAPKTQLNVNFDPFNASQKDITDNQTQLNALKDAIKKCAAKDAKDNNTSVTIKDVEFKIVDGKGVVVFHAEGYKDATYPMSVFLKQKANTQTPQTPSTETKTETGQGEHDTFKYKVTKTQIDGDNPTAQDAVKALKQFVRDNYDNVSESDLASVGDSVAVSTNWTPKTGTKNMGAYGAQAPNDGPMMSFSIAGNDFGIKVHGRPWDPDAENGPDWNSSMDMDLFTIKPDELYVKKAGAQHQDNTLADLKKQAKDLLKQRRDTDHLTNNDLARAGVKDAENLNDGTIDNMDEKALRDLIRKLTDAKKAERKYNPIPEIEVTDPENLSEDDFKKAAEAFLKANYDGTDSLAVDKVPYTVPTSLKPKTDTVLMEPASDTNATGISSIKYTNSDFKKLIFSDKNNQQLFTVSVTYKKKAETPAPTPDALAQMKDDAKKIIDKNPYLTPDQKKEFKNKIDNAPDEKTIKQILKDANDKGKENKNNTTDPNVQQIINNNKGGGDEKKQHELDAAKEAAKKAIDALKNLSEQEKKDLKGKVDKANDINGVNSVVDESKKQNELNGVKKEAKEATFVFLDHGKGGKDDSSDPNHTEDAALNSVLDSTPEEDSTLKTLAEKLKEGSKATAEDIKNALAAAKRQNAINEENAKNAGIAKLDAKKADLVAAYNALTEDQKKSAKDKYEAATKAIDDAKDTVNNATKPSDIMTAVNGVDTSINDAKEDIKKNTPKRDTSQNTYDDQNALKQEKEKQIERIKNSDLPDADKQKAIDDINNAKKLGDPTGIADRALKAKKIADALDKLDKDFNHLNKAQKEAFKKIIEDTDAGDHTNADGTTSDDIDDALANAANTDNAMARLEDLKVIADEFATGDKYKALQDGNKQKKAFDDASTAAGAVLDRDKGDAKGAAEVNDIYADLLKAMQALDNTVKGAGVKTDALAAEIGSDKGLKPSETDPKTPGDSVYTTASADKKKAFDDALTAAEQALKTANDDNANYKKEGATPRTPEQEAKAQKAVDEALDKLIKARLALDGVNTKPLQDEIDKDGKVTSSVEYTNADKDKKKAYDEALQKAKDLIDKLTGKKDASADDHLDTKENKQKALDAALKVLSDAAAALDGKDTTPVPPSDDDNTGSGSESDSGSGTSTSTSGGVNKQNLINQINTTENPGGANPGSGAAGTNPSAPGAGAQGAGMGAVAPGSGAGAAGAGTAGAASAGVDNKAVNNAVENAPEVKQADAAVKQAAATLDEALAQAKRVAADPHATQAQVDAAAAKLADARKALADAQANAAKVRAAVRSRVIKGMRSRGNAGIATGANVATTGLMATMIAAIGGAFATRRMRTKHANRD
ncbi:GA module [Gardnerella sp. DNF00257]|uniref:GA module n=1 Tax=Gardnerella sp. DNF00257 TaxID=2749045 RepID=UPI003BAE24DF